MDNDSQSEAEDLEEEAGHSTSTLLLFYVFWIVFRGGFNIGYVGKDFKIKLAQLMSGEIMMAFRQF